MARDAPDDPDAARRTLRREIRERLRGLESSQRTLDPETVLERLDRPGRVDRVLCYLSDDIEVDLDPVIEALLARGSEVSVPAVQAEHGVMHAVRLESLDPARLDRDRYGLRSPSPPVRLVPFTELDAVLVPGVAFTRTGERLGRGGGYYDRFLATVPGHVRRLGVCHPVQVLESLPTRPHDVAMHEVFVLQGPD